MLSLPLGTYKISTIKLCSVNIMILNNIPAIPIPIDVRKHSRKGKPLDKFE